MFQCTFITCMGKGILPLRYNDIKKLRVKILLWMETVTHMSYWCSHFIDLVVKEHAHKTSESLILFYEEMSGKSGQPSGDSRRAFGHCRKTHREHSESLRVILGEYSEIVVKRILTTRGFRDVSRFWNSGGWQVCCFCIWFGFLCAQVSSGNCNTIEWLEICDFDPKALKSSLYHRRKVRLRNSTEILGLGFHLCTRIRVWAMIGLF